MKTNIFAVLRLRVKFGAMKPRHLAHLAQILEIEGAFKGQLTQVQVDSRKVVPGSLFVALKGENVDGHDFLQEASSKGALAALVLKEYSGPSFGLQLLRVEDVLDSLQELARVILSERRPYVIALTGSYGKTTTKDFITTLLSNRFLVEKTVGNQNSQVGLPLSILNREEEGEVLILEMGMSKPGQIARLVHVAAPECVLLTRIGSSHLEFFGDLEGIAKAKSEIFTSPRSRLGIIGVDAYEYKSVKATGNFAKVTYGPGGDYALEGETVVEKGVRSPPIELPFKEAQFKENFLGAVAIARQLGLSWEEIQKGTRELKAQAHRFEKIERNGVCFIDDSYNASPETMKVALTQLPLPREGGRSIAVLGRMVELGEKSLERHREVGEFALEYVDEVYLIGKECKEMLLPFKKAKKPAHFFDSFEALKEEVNSSVREGDVVLIKGSNSNQLWNILQP